MFCFSLGFLLCTVCLGLFAMSLDVMNNSFELFAYQSILFMSAIYLIARKKSYRYSYFFFCRVMLNDKRLCQVT